MEQEATGQVGQEEHGQEQRSQCQRVGARARSCMGSHQREAEQTRNPRSFEALEGQMMKQLSQKRANQKLAKELKKERKQANKAQEEKKAKEQK